jgi:8-oxo-dGTP diphosphatase
LYTYNHPRPSITVDVAIFRPFDGENQILLIQRAHDPFKGMFALPGGFMEINESLEEAAKRELFEETGIKDIQLTQIQTFSEPDRDPRGRVISTCFGCVVHDQDRFQFQAGSDAAAVSWFGLSDLPDLAFDHQVIIQTAIFKLLTPENPT